MKKPIPTTPFLIGLALLALFQSSHAQSEQTNWQRCIKCEGLFFAGNATKGRCAAGGRHDNSANGFMMDFSQNVSGGQRGWKWCRKCESLFWGYYSTKKGVCPKDGNAHDDQESGEYTLFRAQHPPNAHFTDNWDMCTVCLGLYQTSNNKSICPNGGPHQPKGYNYVVKLNRADAGQSIEYVTKSITLSRICVNDHPEGVWGYVDVEVWELDEDGNKYKQIKSREQGIFARMMSLMPTSRLHSEPYYENESGHPPASGGNFEATWTYKIKKDKLEKGQIYVVIRCRLEAEHKDNDWAATGWHGMAEEAEYGFRWHEAPCIGLIDKDNRGDSADRGDQNYCYTVAGPYASKTDRWHAYRAVFILR
ncbi:MAG: hypothetical protein ACKVU0_10580 [Saprospiraceae bacterium]